ncbi:MAG: hypothetical protein AAB654_21035 [Acidobacteriota bacterium]
MADHYLALVQEYWDTIVRAYMDFQEKKPVILLDIQAAKVYAYPYRGFMADLSPRSRKLLKLQYEEAIKKGQVVVFVRDNEKRKLVSYSFPLHDTTGPNRPAKRTGG